MLGQGDREDDHLTAQRGLVMHTTYVLYAEVSRYIAVPRYIHATQPRNPNPLISGAARDVVFEWYNVAAKHRRDPVSVDAGETECHARGSSAEEPEIIRRRSRTPAGTGEMAANTPTGNQVCGRYWPT